MTTAIAGPDLVNTVVVAIAWLARARSVLAPGDDLATLRLALTAIERASAALAKITGGKS